jgi:PAS domain S-box-containing protein
MAGKIRILAGCGDVGPRRWSLDAASAEIDVERAESLAAVLSGLGSGPDCVVLGEDLADASGLDALAAIRDRRPDLPVLCYAETGDGATAAAATRHGVTEYVVGDELDERGETLGERVAAAVDPTGTGGAPVEDRNDAVVVADASNRVVSAAPGVEELTGYAPGDLIGRPLTALVPERFDEVCRQEVARSTDGGAAADPGERPSFPVAHRDGTELPASIRCAPFSRDGETFVTGVISESPGERHAEADPAEVLDRMGDAFFALDGDWRFTYLNESARALLDVDRSAIGSVVWEAFPEARDTRFEAEYERAMATQDQVQFEEYFPPLDAWFEVTAYPSESGLSVYFRDVTEREEQAAELERQRDHLARTADLGSLVREIEREAVRAESRAELDELVCENLEDQAAYPFAWIGDANRATGAVSVRERSEGGAAYLEDVDITADESETGRGPFGQAVRSGEMRVADVERDESFATWREHARERGFESVAAVPLEHDGALHGVLVFYAEEPDAFGEVERTVLGTLGDLLGHAYSAIDRKAVLMCDDVVELEFEIGDDDLFFNRVTAEGDCRVEMDGFVTRPGGDVVGYVNATGGDPEALVERARGTEGITGAEIQNRVDDEALIELEAERSSIVEPAAAHGGSVRSLAATDGTTTVVVELPQSTDVRRFVSAATGDFESVSLLAQRRREGPAQTRPVFRSRLSEALTERQEFVLETAYRAGYYGWPRRSTGEEVADSIDVSPPTLHEHLRSAQSKLLGLLFDDEAVTSGNAPGTA